VLTAGKVVRRFLIPSIGVTLILYVRHGALVSPRAEVELSPLLRIGRRAKVASFSKIKAGNGPLTIGAGTAIAAGCFIAAGKAGTHIGDGCLIGANCTIVSNTYRFDDLNVPFFGQGEDSKGTVIGNNVFSDRRRRRDRRQRDDRRAITGDRKNSEELHCTRQSGEGYLYASVDERSHFG
jgi:UDP-3-O-[3-hydroxymyristoyl] glucosamine N-acyltransferase